MKTLKDSITEAIVKGHISKKCKYLCFTAKQNNSSISFTSETKDISIFYSKDGDKFESWDGSEIKLDNNELIYVYGDNSSVRCSSRGLLNFSMTGKIATSGNIMSLIDKSCHNTIPFDYAFAYMFYYCTSLITAPKLPATLLASNCYFGMFYRCKSLTTAPELPATTLAKSCYLSMFNGCTSLTTAPLLPAMTLADGCYMSMFEGCTSLTIAPTLPATTLADFCYPYMFNGCAALKSAPALPASTLVNNCYNSMFKGCRKLNHIKAMFTTAPSDDYTDNWLSGVASSGTFVKNTAATWTASGTNAVPKGWNAKTEK